MREYIKRAQYLNHCDRYSGTVSVVKLDSSNFLLTTCIIIILLIIYSLIRKLQTWTELSL